jgi:hypothetical protein
MIFPLRAQTRSASASPYSKQMRRCHRIVSSRGLSEKDFPEAERKAMGTLWFELVNFFWGFADNQESAFGRPHSPKLMENR